jgi:selenocysteine-specific translation elongation factor
VSETKVGTVTHWYGEISVAGIDLEGDLKVGDTIHIAGHTSDFTQAVESMQVDHEDVEEAKAGASIGIKTIDHARIHDDVFRVDADA